MEQKRYMRKANLIITHLIIILFAVHAVLDSLALLEICFIILKPLARVLFTLVAVHAVLGFILMGQTIAGETHSHTFYPVQNRDFQIRRISGILLMILIIIHMTGYLTAPVNEFGAPVLSLFSLISNILMVPVLAVHLITNLKPLFLGSGFKNRTAARIYAILMSVILLAAAAGFICALIIRGVNP